MAKGVRPLLCKLRGCKARRWPRQRLEIEGTSYSVEQVARALLLAEELPGRLDELANSAGYLYDPGWQDALAEVRVFSEERLGDWEQAP